MKVVDAVFDGESENICIVVAFDLIKGSRDREV